VKKKIAAIVVAAGLMLSMSACQPESKVISENISKEADSFNVQRKITVINTRTDKFMFYAEGRCSVERDNGWLIAICRHAENEYRKHLIGPATDAFPMVEQLAPIDVSRYHTLIVMRPVGIIPDLQLRGGQQ
jgi:hypothetical protein